MLDCTWNEDAGIISDKEIPTYINEESFYMFKYWLLHEYFAFKGDSEKSAFYKGAFYGLYSTVFLVIDELDAHDIIAKATKKALDIFWKENHNE